MKWLEVKIIFDSENKGLVSDLISDIFYECGLEGVVVEESGHVPAEDWGRDAIRYEHDAVIGYFQKNETFKSHYKVIEEKIERLQKKHAFHYQVVCSEIDDADWAESWKDYFWPQKIGDQIILKPAWREYERQKDEIVIEIDPGMAFGTGTHPTTGLCILLIEKYIQPGDVFLDVGAGSGILMIAAAKLGARKVYGTDHDNVAIEIARKNLLLNMVPAADSRVINCHLADDVTGRFDIVAANLSKASVFMLLNDARRLLNDDGVLIVSGVTEDDKDAMEIAMDRLAFNIIEVVKKEDWLAMACRFFEK